MVCSVCPVREEGEFVVWTVGAVAVLHRVGQEKGPTRSQMCWRHASWSPIISPLDWMVARIISLRSTSFESSMYLDGGGRNKATGSKQTPCQKKTTTRRRNLWCHLSPGPSVWFESGSTGLSWCWGEAHRMWWSEYSRSHGLCSPHKRQEINVGTHDRDQRQRRHCDCALSFGHSEAFIGRTKNRRHSATDHTSRSLWGLRL